MVTPRFFSSGTTSPANLPVAPTIKIFMPIPRFLLAGDFQVRRYFVWVTGGIGQPEFQRRAEGFGAREPLSA
jgi:hypothetical protein